MVRIASLLPSATDTVVALGAGSELVGVSHSCSGPFDNLPKLTSTWLDLTASSREIDSQVRAAQQPLYRLDIAALEQLAPDVIISQSLCDVCALPSGDVEEAVRSLPGQPLLVDLAPERLGDLPACFQEVGRAIGRGHEAEYLIENWHTKLDRYYHRYHHRYYHRHPDHPARRLRVAFLDWLDPPFAAGHWVPDMLEWLGVESVLARPGERSYAVTWEEVRTADPDLIIAACCGFDTERALVDTGEASERIVCLNGQDLFSRPSPALLPSLALLSETIGEHLRHA